MNVMNVQLNLFPGGVSKAMTLSYDDGREHDRQLVEIMNRYGMKGTFHLNSGFLGKDRYVTAEEVSNLYKGHEVSAHTSTHPFLEIIPREGVVMQLLEDRKQLEKLVGYPIRGMSYPYGTYNDNVLAMLPGLGLEYSRTTRSHGTFEMPTKWTEWHPTCHHRDMLKLGKDFLDKKAGNSSMQLLYVWGHSYEFNDNNNWEDIEHFCDLMGNSQDIWYATNIEIVDYIRALQELRFTVSQTSVYNPSAIDVWISVDGEACKVSAGHTAIIGE